MPPRKETDKAGRSDYVDTIIEQWRIEDPDLDTHPLQIFGRIHRVFLMYSNEIADTFEEFGINSAGFDVLASLKRAGGDYTLTPTQLAESALVTSGGISLRLNRLEDAGLVERLRDRSDRRAVYVRLTDEGRDLVAKVARVHFAREAEMMKGLSPDQVDQLAGLLRQLGDSLRMHSSEDAAAS